MCKPNVKTLAVEIDFKQDEVDEFNILRAFDMLLNEKVETNTNSSTLSGVTPEQCGDKTND